MKAVAEAINKLEQKDITEIDKEGSLKIEFRQVIFHILWLSNYDYYSLLTTDVEIIAEDVPGWQVANLGKLTVALDVTVTEELKQEGISRELVNRIQNLRKRKDLK
jgi:isoleucyl-tRNA synthetase